MNEKFLASLLMAMLPNISFGDGPQQYQCGFGELQRRVEILYEAGGTVPCEVHYYKDTEAPDERQVLWRAVNDAGYCETKTREFVAKLEGMGWSCGQGMDTGTEAEAQSTDVSEPDAEPMGDDTDALLPGEETGSTENQ